MNCLKRLIDGPSGLIQDANPGIFEDIFPGLEWILLWYLDLENSLLFRGFQQEVGHIPALAIYKVRLRDGYEREQSPVPE